MLPSHGSEGLSLGLSPARPGLGSRALQQRAGPVKGTAEAGQLQTSLPACCHRAPAADSAMCPCPPSGRTGTPWRWSASVSAFSQCTGRGHLSRSEPPSKVRPASGQPLSTDLSVRGHKGQSSRPSLGQLCRLAHLMGLAGHSLSIPSVLPPSCYLPCPGWVPRTFPSSCPAGCADLQSTSWGPHDSSPPWWSEPSTGSRHSDRRECAAETPQAC